MEDPLLTRQRTGKGECELARGSLPEVRSEVGQQVGETEEAKSLKSSEILTRLLKRISTVAFAIL